MARAFTRLVCTADADSVIGTAALEGWPHSQHRGGPRGFIKVLGPRSLAFAD